MGIELCREGPDKKELNDFLLGSNPKNNYPLGIMLLKQEQTEKNTLQWLVMNGLLSHCFAKERLGGVEDGGCQYLR